jgi:hypothetical protein
MLSLVQFGLALDFSHCEQFAYEDRVFLDLYLILYSCASSIYSAQFRASAAFTPTGIRRCR